MTITYKKTSDTIQNPDEEFDEIDKMNDYLNKTIEDAKDTLYAKLLKQYNKK